MINVNMVKIIERYKINIDHGPNDMYIEVYQKEGSFFAECNYSLWYKKQDAPYHHRHPDHDIERAVKLVLNTIKPDDNANLEDYCWVNDSNPNMVILGTGEMINKKDFKK